IAPTSAVAGTSNNTETLTYTETVAGGTNAGAVELTVPANWSAPSITNGAAGCTTSWSGTVGVSGQVITVSNVTLAQSATLTYTETVAGGTNAGAVELTVPANWSAPSITNGAAGCTTASPGTVGVSGQVITVSNVTLAQNATLTITYGATTGACSSSTGAS